MLERSLKNNILRFLFFAYAFYLVISFIVITIYLKNHYNTNEQTSILLSKSAHTLLNSEEYREALKILNGSYNFGFTTIIYQKMNKEIFRLNFSNTSTSEYWPTFQYTHEIKTMMGEKEPTAKLIFYENLTSKISAIGLMLLTSVSVLTIVILHFKRKIVVSYHKEIEFKKAEHLSTLSTQVAHDIRSPLAALDSIYQDLDKIDGEKSNLIKAALSRIHSIADGLLTSARTGNYQLLSLQQVSLIKVVEEIVAEKKVQFAKYSKLNLTIENSTTSSMVEADCTELARILSNLINNSAEAMNYNGTISLSLSENKNQLCLAVTDQGQGIPASIIESLGSKGTTHGKANGNGLGLYHAFTRMQEMSGELQIVSTSQGTTINLIFPKSTTYLLSKKMVLVDNDPLVRLNWSISAKHKDIDLNVFASSHELLKELAKIEHDTPIYLDDDLGEEMRGVDLAEKLFKRGFTNLHLCTGHKDDQYSHLSFFRSVSGKEFPQSL